MGKRGPKPTYERIGSNKKGAPLLSMRVDTPVFERIKSRPEGPRAYVERLVTEEAARCGEPLAAEATPPDGRLVSE